VKSPADLTLVPPAKGGSYVAHAVRDNFENIYAGVGLLAATEAMTGLLYVPVLIARLVGLYSTPRSS
jgi:hypothetical protein